MMAKPLMKPEYEQLNGDMIATFLAGHHAYRSDLPYPESHSDMQAGMMALMRMYEIKRRPIALEFRELLPTTDSGKAE